MEKFWQYGHFGMLPVSIELTTPTKGRVQSDIYLIL
jgi:hypothetical protein